MAKCICPDFRANIDKINGPLQLQQARMGIGYQGKRFRYCPWCSSELTLEASDYSDPASSATSANPEPK